MHVSLLLGNTTLLLEISFTLFSILWLFVVTRKQKTLPVFRITTCFFVGG